MVSGLKKIESYEGTGVVRIGIGELQYIPLTW